MVVVVFVEAFQAIEGVGAYGGIAVGDVLLAASGLFTVLLRIVLTVEFPEGDRLGVFLIPAVKFLYALLVFVSFVRRRFRYHNATHKAETDNCTVNL